MKVINGFLKWLALLVFTISTGLLVIILLASRPTLDYFWLRLSMLAAVAFIGSLAARLLFHRLPGVILFLITLISEILALLIIDYFYDSLYRFSFLTHALVFQTPSVSDGAQGALLLLISLPTLFFLRHRKKTPKIQKEPAPPKPARPKFSLRQRMQPIFYKLNPGNWQVTHNISRKIKGFSLKKKGAAPAKPVHISAKPTDAAPKTPLVIKTSHQKAAGAKAAAPRKSKRKQLNDVKLMGEEEHVCPYCLEKVDKNNKIVICPECGTWHHQDCWDLTGSCGVAHRNEL